MGEIVRIGAGAEVVMETFAPVVKEVAIPADLEILLFTESMRD